MLPLLYSISEKAGKGRKEPMKMIGVGGGYRMEKEFDVEIKEVLSRVQRVKAESLDDAINKAMDRWFVDYMYGEALYKPEMKEGNPIRLYSLDEITEIFCKLGLRICNSLESRVLIMIFNWWFIPYGNKSSSNLYFFLLGYISVRNEI